MNRLPRIFNAVLFSFGLVLGLHGCTVYEVAPGVYEPVPPSTFERSWLAVIGAMEDEGVLMVQQDRAAGLVSGTLGGSGVRALLQPQADGSVRVEFNTTGDTDRSLNERIVRSYNRRMGR